MSIVPDITLSVLIPAYNYVCVNLVHGLHQQAKTLGISHEIIVADDGSCYSELIEANNAINDIPCCQYIIRQENVGRACIRNFLTKKSKGTWLLFLDCDMEIPNNQFLKRYMENTTCSVIDGGIHVGGDPDALINNIRFLYENKTAPNHTAEARKRNPYKSFRTTNFMIHRAVALANPFDERFRYYGYEDVLFGKHLKNKGVDILHIDNPMVLTDYESNEVFIKKTEEAMRTLRRFRKELRGYSQIITAADTLNHSHMAFMLRIWHKLAWRWERRVLTGNTPWLCLFNIYRLGYYLSLTKQ